MAITKNQLFSHALEIIFFAGVLQLHSCKPSPIEPATAREHFSPPGITRIKDLPDSLKPMFIPVGSIPKLVPIPARVTPSKLSTGDNEPGTTASRGSLYYTRYTTEQGLAMDAIAGTLCDSRGLLWLGTQGSGVSIFDGREFRTLYAGNGLSGNVGSAIFEDRAGRIWLGSHAGLDIYDGRTFRTVTNVPALQGAVSVIDQDSKGRMWLGTPSAGIVRISGSDTTIFDVAEGRRLSRIRKICEGRSGDMYFASMSDLIRIDGRDSVSIIHDPAGVPGTEYWCVKTDPSGDVWMGTSAGIARVRGEKIQYTSLARDVERKSIISIVGDRKGALWSCTSHGELFRLENGTWTRFSPPLEDPGIEVISILFDAQDDLWLATQSHGILKVANPACRRLSSQPGLEYAIMSMSAEQNGTVWFASNYSTGLVKYEGGRTTRYDIPDLKDPVGWANVFVEKAGSVLASATDRLYRLERDTFWQYKNVPELGTVRIYSMDRDPAGNLWIGTLGRGAFRVGRDGITQLNRKQGLISDEIWRLRCDNKGRVWMAGPGGLSMYDGEAVHRYGDAQGLKSRLLWEVLCDDKGNVWVGSQESGVIRFDGKDFLGYSTKDGLPDPGVATMSFTRAHELALGTNYGLAMLQGFRRKNDSTGHPPLLPVSNDLDNATLARDYMPVIRDYSPRTGYPIRDIDNGQSAILEDKDGALWLGIGSMLSGLMHLDIRQDKSDPSSSPRVQFTGVRLNGRAVPWYSIAAYPVDPATLSQQEVSALGFPLDQEHRLQWQQDMRGVRFDSIQSWNPLPFGLDLPYSHNDISIDFRAVYPSRNTMLRYRYKLEGMHRDWSEPSDRTTAEFGNLREGKYRLWVQVRDPEGVWQEPVSWAFRVRPPWWRTWWMYLAYGLMALLGARAWLAWRERKLMERNRELERKVEDATSTIRSERDRNQELLLNILPADVAEELKASGTSKAREIPQATVLFTDFCNFTRFSEHLDPQSLVNEINALYSTFDEIIGRYGIEKIKTIGDSYMCAGGLVPGPGNSAADTVSAALAILDHVNMVKQQRMEQGQEFLDIRIGCHTGPVVAGIVGVKKFAYDIWGDTVNTASRMESSGEPGRVNISGATYEQVRQLFKCTHRGKIEAKNKGQVDMYFVEPAASSDDAMA